MDDTMASRPTFNFDSMESVGRKGVGSKGKVAIGAVGDEQLAAAEPSAGERGCCSGREGWWECESFGAVWLDLTEQGKWWSLWQLGPGTRHAWNSVVSQKLPLMLGGRYDVRRLLDNCAAKSAIPLYMAQAQTTFASNSICALGLIVARLTASNTKHSLGFFGHMSIGGPRILNLR